MTLEEVIRYAIKGVIFESCEAESCAEDIDELVALLIDFGGVTDRPIKELLK